MPADDAPKVELPDDDEACRKYLETCRRAGVEPVSRECEAGLIQAWNEIVAGRPDPTQH